jgi:hypothetical protein
VAVQWLDLIVVTEAAGDLVLSSLSCVYFGRQAALSRLAARRVAATSLSAVNGALALEATLYLGLSSPATGLEQVAVLVVRSVLLGASAFISLLVWRHARR